MGKRRDKGEGTEIKFNEDKQLYYQRLGYKDKVGRSKVKAIYGKTKGEVTEKRKAWQKTLDAGIDVDANKTTLTKWLEKWLQVYKKGSVEITTYENYLQYVKIHIMPEIGSLKLRDITKTKLQEFINEKSKVLKPSSLEIMRSILGNSLKYAVEDDILLKNPAIGIKIPKEQVDTREQIKPFSKEEIEKITALFKGKKVYNLVLVAAFTGMRVGEVCGLRWIDVDFKHKIIHVKQQIKYVRTTKKNIAGGLKTKNAYREIPFDQKLLAIFKKQKAWQAENELKLGTAYLKSDFVFTDITGEMIIPNYVSGSFRYNVKQSGVKYRSFHNLRHTFASIAISRGVNIKAISMTLGHATITETLDTYGHLMPGDGQTVTAAVSEFLADL